MRRRTSATTSLDLVGQRPAVGVAQHERLGTRLLGGVEHPEGELGVAAVAVEEVLGVEEDPRPARIEVGRPSPPTIATASSSVVRSASVTWRSEALATMQTASVLGVDEAGESVVVAGGIAARATRRAERDEGRARAASARPGPRAKNSSSFGFAPGQPPSM